MSVIEKTREYVGEARDKMAVQLVAGALNQLPNVSDETLVKLTYPLEQFLSANRQGKKVVQILRKRAQEKHPTIQLIRRMIRDLNPNAKKALAYWMINTFSERKQALQFEERYGFYPPLSILISPTMRCNLRCEGCYAGQYSKEKDLPSEIVHRVIDECREMGTRWISVSGGEPFMYEALLDIIADNRDMVFQIYTNATLINDKVAARLAELGNVALNLSVEGFESETDERRGRGIFRKVMAAMDRLHEAGVFFGASLTSLRKNYQVITSDEFMDMLVSKGAFNIWLFNYIPVGSLPDMNLMPTPEQRAYVRLRTNRLRHTKPILIIDFWANGPWVGGCQSAGAGYLHINSNGDVEPCVFNHFAVDNIKDKTLIEALQSPFFKAIREGIPFSENTLRPCPLIDHPWRMREIIKEHGAHPTDPGAEAFITTLADDLDRYAVRMGEIYERAWNEHEAAWVEWWLGDAEEPPAEEWEESLAEPQFA